MDNQMENAAQSLRDWNHNEKFFNSKEENSTENKDALSSEINELSTQHNNQDTQIPSAETSTFANNSDEGDSGSPMEQAYEPEQVESSARFYTFFDEDGSQEECDELFFEYEYEFEHLLKENEFHHKNQGTQDPISEIAMVASNSKGSNSEYSMEADEPMKQTYEPKQVESSGVHESCSSQEYPPEENQPCLEETLSFGSIQCNNQIPYAEISMSANNYDEGYSKYPMEQVDELEQVESSENFSGSNENWSSQECPPEENEPCLEETLSYESSIQYNNQIPYAEISMSANNYDEGYSKYPMEQANEPKRVESSEQFYGFSGSYGNYGSQEYPSQKNGPQFDSDGRNPKQCSMEQSRCQTNDQPTSNQSAFIEFQLNQQVSIPVAYFTMGIKCLNDIKKVEDWTSDMKDKVRAERRKFKNNESARRRRRERKAQKEREEQLQLKDYKIIQKPKTTGKIKTTTKSKN